MPEPGRLHDGFLPGRHLIDAVGAGGFRFAEMSHRGSILALPSGILAWEVAAPEELAIEAFVPLIRESGTFDHLLLGMGASFVPLAPGLRAALRQAGLARVEPMATTPAAQTYNILAGEGRRVAAALIAIG